MKAIVCTRYGSPHTLRLLEVDRPVPKEKEVLVKVHATAINDYDWSMVRGKPYLYRLLFGISKPKWPIPGMELSGTVEALGPAATAFRKGDAVYGDISAYGFGSFAEYVCINENALSLKPRSISFEEAASIPHAALLAAQGLYDYGRIQQGQKLLINGAGGGVGTFGLQLGRLHEAEVTGVDTGSKLGMMKKLGFDHVIDYKKVDFTRNGQRYDLILDAKTSRSIFAYLRALKPEGTYVTVGGYLSRLLMLLFLKPLLSVFSRKKVRIVALKPNQGLPAISELFESGRLRCVLDGPFTLQEVPEALQYFGEGKHQGKVVISVQQ